MTPLAIDFVVRSDAEQKPGGDTLQVGQYCEFLQREGHSVRTIPFSPTMRLRPGALVHIVNIDRPFDFLLSCNIARTHKIFVSPIHHSLSRVRQMRAEESGYGIRSFLGHILSEEWRELIAFGARSARSRSLRDCAAAALFMLRCLNQVSNVWRNVGNQLDQAQAVFLLAKGEGRDIVRDTGWSASNGQIVPNGRPTRTDLEPATPSIGEWEDSRDISVICVGRVEPRKRQLELARAANELGTKVTFIGTITHPDSAYGRSFERLVQDSPYVEWLGSLSHEDVLNTMRHAKVLLNGSWVEVQSLVELEAAFAGCYVVTGPNGNSTEWLPNSVQQVESFDAKLLVSTAAQRAEMQVAPPAPSYNWTWLRASESILGTYGKHEFQRTDLSMGR